MLSLLSTLEEGDDDDDDDDTQTLKLTVMIGKFHFPRLSLEKEKIVMFQVYDSLMVGNEEFSCFICTSKNFFFMEWKKISKFVKVLALVAVEEFQKHVDKFLEEFILVDNFWKRNRAFIPFSSRKTFKVCFNVFLFMVCFQVLPPFRFLAHFTVEDVQNLDVKLLDVFIPKECSRKREVIPKLKHAAMHGKRRYEMDIPRHKDSVTVFIHALDDGKHEKSILFDAFLVTNEGPSREERSLKTIQGVLHHVVAISSLATGNYARKNLTWDEDDMLSPSAGKFLGKFVFPHGLFSSMVSPVVRDVVLRYDNGRRSRNFFSTSSAHNGGLGTASLIRDAKLHGYYSVVHACMSKGPMVHAAKMSFSNHCTQRMVQGKAGLLPYRSRHFEIGVERSFCLLPHMVHLYPDNDLFVDYPPDINTLLFSRQGKVASLFSFAADFKGKRTKVVHVMHAKDKPVPRLEELCFCVKDFPCLHVPLGQGQKSSFSADDKDKADAQIPFVKVKVSFSRLQITPEDKRDVHLFCPGKNRRKEGPPDNKAMHFSRQGKEVSLFGNSADFMEKVSFHVMHLASFKSSILDKEKRDFMERPTDINTMCFVKILKPMDFSQGLFVHGMHVVPTEMDSVLCSHPDA